MGERAGKLEEKEKEKEKERKEIVISSSSSEEMVKGESFLPKKMLRVLLVEADDSTRQIIAALLRKCSYRVSAVADGLEAWEKLKGRPHNVNLVLTEVELPSISGYALLTLIMEHDICKSIPVIMMSSKDSISLVLKCMLKGAADFLIKPIRKNELKNLWQHVWRRQINEARNVPECKNVGREKVEVASKGNGANSHSSDNLASAVRNKHCHEKCSDSQSSCGTPYLEAETACKPNMPGKHMKLDNASSRSSIGEHEECAEMVEKSAMPESDSGEVASYHGAHMLVGMRLQEDHTCVKSTVKDIEKQPDSLGENACFTGESNCQTCALTEPASGAIDLIGNFDRCLADLDGHFLADDGTKKVNVTPELELSLRQMHPSYTKDERTEQHTVHHSKASAFSRYDSSKTLQPEFPISASNFALPKEGANSSHQHSFNQLPAVPNSPRHGSAPTKSQESLTTLFLGQSGQLEAAFPVAHLGFVPIPGVRFDSVYSGYGYLCPPVYYMQPGFPPFWSKKSQHEVSPLPTSSSVHSTSEVNNSEQAFYLKNESTHHSADRAVPPDDKRLEMAGTIKHGSPALGFSSGLTSNLSNDVAGVLCSKNEENSVPVAAIARPTESVNDNHLLVHDGIQGKDSRCTSQREAALIKFRLKRKDRCYEKKVRYHSRKRLAEQRPRVKGQFIRQMPNDTIL